MVNITLLLAVRSSPALRIAFAPIIPFPVDFSFLVQSPICIAVVMNPSLATQITLGGGGDNSGGQGCVSAGGTTTNNGILAAQWSVDTWSPVGSSALFGIAFEFLVDVSQQ